MAQDFWRQWHLEKDTFPSVALWWDAGKKHIKRLSQSFSRDLVRGRRHRIHSLEASIFQLEQRRSAGEDVRVLLADAKRDLELEHMHLAHGARTRARER